MIYFSNNTVFQNIARDGEVLLFLNVPIVRDT